jgi:hypothetical protein
MIFKKETHITEDSNLDFGMGPEERRARGRRSARKAISARRARGGISDDYAVSIYDGGGKTNLNTNKITTIIVVIITKFFAQQNITTNTTIENIPIVFEISKIDNIYTILYMINLYGPNALQNIII